MTPGAGSLGRESFGGIRVREPYAQESPLRGSVTSGENVGFILFLFSNSLDFFPAVALPRNVDLPV